MIAAWILYALLVGCLLSAGALALEHVLRAHRRPARWVWTMALVASVGWPVALWAWTNRPAPPSPTLVQTTAPMPAARSTRPRPTPEPVILQVAPDSPLRSLDRPILTAWALATAALGLFLLVLVFRTRRLRRGWRTARVAGREVLVSGGWGPAVVGFLRPRVVLPGWCEELDPDRLGFVLEHEVEHLRAGDLRLLLTAGLLPILVPWHLPLWWQLSRLRTAVEGDCDLRVLGRHPTGTRAYIDLLLAMGRRPAVPAPLAALLSEPYQTLKRRIRIMTTPGPKRPWLSGSLFTGTAVLLGILACNAPPPTDAGPESSADASRTGSSSVAATGAPTGDSSYPVFTPYTVSPQPTNADEVTGALEARYAALSEISRGRVTVWLFIGEGGRVRDTRVSHSSGSRELDQLALRTLADVTFTPALNRDQKIPVWVSLPVVFGSVDGSALDKPAVPSGPAPRVLASPALDEAAAAGETGVVTGVVRDVTSGRPLPNAQVYVPGTGRGTLADIEGRFRIEGVPAGERPVAVELIGYAQSEVRVAVGPEGATELEFPMQATAIPLKPLVVARGGVK